MGITFISIYMFGITSGFLSRLPTNGTTNIRGIIKGDDAFVFHVGFALKVKSKHTYITCNRK